LTVFSPAKSALKLALNMLGYRIEKIDPEYPEYPANRRLIDPVGVELLADTEFQSS